jgi:DNA-binding NtrC family response regulator
VVANNAVCADDLPDHIRACKPKPVRPTAQELPFPAPDPASGPINLREIKEWAGREAQKRVILELQSRTNITRQDLARLLGVDAKTLRSRLREMSSEAASGGSSRPTRR